MASKKQTMPKTLGTCVDRLYDLRQKRFDLQKEIANIKKAEAELADRLINELPKSDATGVAGRKARAVVQTKVVPQVQDWPTLHKYILRTKDFSLLQRRLSESAIKERWDDSKKIPGVEPFNAVKVSVTKV